MNHLDYLESKSIYILREAYASFKNTGMLWSIGKDSTVLLFLCRKAFFGHVPFTLIHIDTGFKIKKMIEYRDYLVEKLELDLLYAINEKALKAKQAFPFGTLSRVECCKVLKTETFKRTIIGAITQYRYNHYKKRYEPLDSPQSFDAIILGIRADEEGTRSKERYFSKRTDRFSWDIEEQAPEFWNQYNIELRPGEHMRIHPLLDWTELDIWEYILRENIPVIDLYFSKKGKRYRSLGCAPCTQPIESDAKNVSDIVNELKSGKLSRIAERAGREQDKEDRGTLEMLRREGYM